MVLEPERAATLVAERLRRPALERLAAGRPGEGAADRPAGSGGAGGAPTAGGSGGKDWLVRRTLEELGIHCEATSEMQDLKGFLIASPRGAEILISDRLGPDERLAVYAHLLAHAVLEHTPTAPDAPAAPDGFFSRLEYVEGREPGPRSGAERRAELAADALAQAILRGHLEGVPRYTYRRTREPAHNAGLRPALGRFWLEFCHRVSLALFWHLPQYKKLRSRREMAYLVRRLERIVRVAYAC